MFTDDFKKSDKCVKCVNYIQFFKTTFKLMENTLKNLKKTLKTQLKNDKKLLKNKQLSNPSTFS